MSYIENEKHWRISKSGFSIKTGWSDEKKIIAHYPGKPHPVDPDQYQEWLENAELICELYNKHLELQP